MLFIGKEKKNKNRSSFPTRNMGQLLKIDRFEDKSELKDGIE
jgi:hypothetical protein